MARVPTNEQPRYAHATRRHVSSSIGKLKAVIALPNVGTLSMTDLCEEHKEPLVCSLAEQCSEKPSVHPCISIASREGEADKEEYPWATASLGYTEFEYRVPSDK